MKRFVLMLTLSLLSASCFAQLSTKQLPRSFRSNITPRDITLLEFAAPDVDALLLEDEQVANTTFKPQRCAAIIPTNIDFFEKATYIDTKEADIYFLKVRMPYAQALNFYSEDFFMPKGSELYLYNPDHSKVLGAYTSDNNNEDNVFATDYVYGEEIIFEYYQPKWVSQQAHLQINEMSYFYRDVYNFEQEKASAEYRSSGSCNVNVNCSEGDDYRDIQRAVCRIYVKMGSYGGGWCTGTLINNTNNDKTPYVISAAHCIEYTTQTSQFNQFVFYFNYEASGCSTPTSEPGYTSLTGCSRLAYDNTYAQDGSDYLLLKLKNEIPESINPYWVGWTRSTSASQKGVGIHHPSGDIKKISTYTNKVVSDSYQGNTARHWRVKWVQTTHGYGITEGGSSGSGLFNKDKKLVGTLSGGMADCSQSADYQYDWYGKFSIHFGYLKQWLDPINTDAMTCNGRNFSTASLEDAAGEGLAFSVYPNPAKDIVNISLSDIYDKAYISVLDELGRVMLSQDVEANTSAITLDISSLPKGTFFVRLYCDKKSSVRKITKQ